MSTNSSSSNELLAMIQARAPELRKAGILALELEGLKVTFAPYEPEPAFSDEEDDPELDVLEDPATYGNKKTVPGRRKDERS